MSVNKVILIGHLGRDPEIKNANGIAIANFSIATSKSWKDEGGEKQQKTEWHNIVAFRKTAELAGKYLAKGREVYVEGELQTRTWADKETGALKYKTEIVASSIQFLGKANQETTTTTQTTADQSTTFGDEIPF